MGWPAIAAFAGGAAGGTAIGGVVGSAMSPVNRATLYTANKNVPNLVPSAPDLLQAYLTGHLAFPATLAALKMNGVSAETLNLSGDVPGAGWENQLRNIWQRVARSHRPPLSLGEVYDARNRGVLDNDGAMYERFRELGYHRSNFALLGKLRQQIPSPSDLVMFALKEAWDEPIVARFQYDAERPPQLDHWIEQQGLFGDLRTPAEIAAGGDPITPAMAYWRAHWSAISPQQAYEMFQRLRPGRMGQLGPQFGAVRPFTLDDVRSVLKIHDYPLPYRDQLAAVAYRLPRLLDIVRGFEADAFQAPELEQKLLDRGYNPTDATWLRGFYERRKAEKLTGKLPKSLATSALRAYREGVYTRQQAAYATYQIWYTGTSQAATFQQSNRQRQQQIADGDTFTQGMLDKEDLDLSVSRVIETKRLIRQRFLRGDIAAGQARAQLQDLGLAQPRIDQLIADWTFQLQGRHIELQASKILQLVADGVLPANQGRFRIINLGYDMRDADLLLTDAAQRLSTRKAAADARLATTEKQRQKALVAQARALQHEVAAVAKQLSRQATPAKLHRLVVHGIILPAAMLRELVRQGTRPDMVPNLVREAVADRALWLTEQAQKAERKRRADDSYRKAQIKAAAQARAAQPTVPGQH